jgi:ABC-type amino acid transport substrate-binding protein
MMIRQSGKWWLALLLAFALIGASCSSDSDDSSASGGSSDDSSSDDSSSDDSSSDDSSSDDSSSDDSSSDDSSSDDVVLTQDGGSILDEIVDRGELRVGMTLQFPPQMYLDDAGDPAGYDVVLMEMMAEDLGVELNIFNQEFDALIPGLLAGQWDMLSVGLAPRPPRLLSMYFSNSYVPYDQVLVATAGSNIAPTIEAFNADGITIAALQGSTAAGQVEAQFPNATLAEFPQQDAAFLDVATGRSDALVVESYLAEGFILGQGGVEVVPLSEPLQIEFGAFAMPYGDDEFLHYLNNWLQYYKNNGTLDEIYDEIFGSDPLVNIWPRQ